MRFPLALPLLAMKTDSSSLLVDIRDYAFEAAGVSSMWYKTRVLKIMMAISLGVFRRGE